MSNAELLVKELAELEDTFKKTRKALVDGLKPQFFDLFRPVFEANPNFGAAVWTQYTPYFNDGDPCEFSRHEIAFYSTSRLEADGADNLDSYDGDLDNSNFIKQAFNYLHHDVIPDYYVFTRYTPETWANSFYGKQGRTQIEEYERTLASYGHTKDNIAAKLEATKGLDELDKVLNSIPSDAYEMMFGDGVKVVVTRDGIDEQEYSHD